MGKEGDIRRVRECRRGEGVQRGFQRVKVYREGFGLISSGSGAAFSMLLSPLRALSVLCLLTVLLVATDS